MIEKRPHQAIGKTAPSAPKKGDRRRIDIVIGRPQRGPGSRYGNRRKWGKKLGYDPNKKFPGGGTTMKGWTPPSWKKIKADKGYKPGAMNAKASGRDIDPGFGRQVRPGKMKKIERRQAIYDKLI